MTKDSGWTGCGRGAASFTAVSRLNSLRGKESARAKDRLWSPPLSDRRLGQMDAHWMARARLPNQEVLQFTRHLAMLFGSGVSLVRCLDVLLEQADNPVLAEVLWSISKDLQGGRSLSAACARFPGIFHSTYVSVLKVSEMTGQLHQSLTQLAQWQERDSKQQAQLKAALMYPAFVLTLTLVMSLWLCYSILPGILAGLAGSGELPLPTRLLMGFVHLIRQPLGVGGLLALVVSGVGGGIHFWRNPSERARRRLWSLLLPLPVVGPALRDCSLVRYCAAAQVLLHGGTDLLRMLDLAAQASGNPWLDEDKFRLRQAVENAESLGRALGQRRELYGPLLPSLVGGCEEIGSLEPAFVRTAMFLEDEVVYRFQVLQQALEPILLLFLAVLVLFFLLSVMLPLYSQLQSL
jgi:type II secretory pathway component PulF